MFIHLYPNIAALRLVLFRLWVLVSNFRQSCAIKFLSRFAVVRLRQSSPFLMKTQYPEPEMRHKQSIIRFSDFHCDSIGLYYQNLIFSMKTTDSFHIFAFCQRLVQQLQSWVVTRWRFKNFWFCFWLNFQGYPKSLWREKTRFSQAKWFSRGFQMLIHFSHNIAAPRLDLFRLWVFVSNFSQPCAIQFLSQFAIVCLIQS